MRLCLDAPMRQANGTVVVWAYGVGLVIERSLVRLPAGALPGNLAGALPGNLGQHSLPSMRGR